MLNDGQHFMDNPEVNDLFEKVLPELIDESDRGAVIIGADVVDSQLTNLFQNIISADVSNKKKKSLFDYAGPFGTFSSKSNIAFALGYINKNTFTSIDNLRDIRNSAAHSNKEFSIVDNQQKIREIYNLGNNIPTAVGNLAVEFIVNNFIRHLSNTKDEEGCAIFSTPKDCIDYLADNPKLVKPLEEKLPKYEFALGVILLCAIIIHKGRNK